MGLFGKSRKDEEVQYYEQQGQQAPPQESSISIVRVKPQPRKHKVIAYGYRVLTEGEVPPAYWFQYLPDPEMPEDLHPGVVPAGFSSGVPVDDNMIYFHTRESPYGPEFQAVYMRPDPEGSDVPAFSMELDWTGDVDGLWVEALQRLEESRELSEEALGFLDADPLWLFGIADPATQRALEKTAVVPMLRCIGQKPCLEEWFAYLNADEEADAEYKWVVESFAEVELPPNWTSFKGVGSVVCYLNNETNDTTWKHPFYDYFAQLLNHCRRSTHEEHIKLRINRVLWAYESESQTDVSSQMPLVSPKYVKILGEILKCDLVEEPFMVRTLKTFLKAFSQMYHEGELDTQEVKWCLEIVENERSKDAVAKGMHLEQDPSEQLDAGTTGQLYCIECGTVATCYCPECEDCLCEQCFERLHAKGNRAKHEPNHFILCAICKVMPAKLQCTYTRGKYCVDCYRKKHAKTLPKFLDLKPLKIDYKRSAKQDRERVAALSGAPAAGLESRTVGPGALENGLSVMDADPEVKESFSKPAPLETTLGDRWHAFYDLRGVKYYYNFENQESMRRPADEMINPEHAADAIALKKSKKEVLGQIAMSKEPRLLAAWAEGTERG